MREIRYVTLDPTGNLTCLVLDPVTAEEETVLTQGLLSRCEQVAYLEPPVRPEAAARIRLMGGEFCGNAAMGTAAWLLRDLMREGERKQLLLEVSGAEEPVLCTVRKEAGEFEGTVVMPGLPAVSGETYAGETFTAVRMEGIVHLIREGPLLNPKKAEALLREIAEQLPDAAAGLLQWNRETREMIPLVYVRGSDSLVWEHGCGSGSAAVGAREAIRKGCGLTVTEISQPGGVIRTAAEAIDGKIASVTITGRIRFDGRDEIFPPAGA